MITLQFPLSLQGVSSVNNAIVFTLNGREVEVNQPDVYRTLAQGFLTSIIVGMYAPLTSVSAVISNIMLVNVTSSAATVTLYIGGIDSVNQFTGTFTIPANGMAIYSNGQWLVYDDTGTQIGATNPFFVQLTNACSWTVPIGTPVYASPAGFWPGQANNQNTSDIVGLVGDVSIGSLATGNVQVGGPLTATTAQWDAVVTGESGGLMPGCFYVLDPNNVGKLVIQSPLPWTNQCLVLLGYALTSTVLSITIEQAILRR